MDTFTLEMYPWTEHKEYLMPEIPRPDNRKKSLRFLGKLIPMRKTNTKKGRVRKIWIDYKDRSTLV